MEDMNHAYFELERFWLIPECNIDEENRRLDYNSESMQHNRHYYQGIQVWQSEMVAQSAAQLLSAIPAIEVRTIDLSHKHMQCSCFHSNLPHFECGIF